MAHFINPSGQFDFLWIIVWGYPRERGGFSCRPRTGGTWSFRTRIILDVFGPGRAEDSERRWCSRGLEVRLAEPFEPQFAANFAQQWQGSALVAEEEYIIA